PAEDGIRDRNVTGVQTCALPIYHEDASHAWPPGSVGLFRFHTMPLRAGPSGEDRRAWSGDRSPGSTVALSGFSALRTPITQRSGGCGLGLAGEMTAAADGLSRESVRMMPM